MEQVFLQFVREKQFLDNVSERTLKAFRDCYSAWKRTVGEQLPTKDNIKEFVIGLRQSGIAITTTNYYIREMNSFLTWLYANEHIPEKIRIKKLKEPQKVLKVFSDEQLKRLLSFKPKTFFEHRLYALVCLVVDTGVRIEEALTLKRQELDLDNLLVTVTGKGDKQRIVPMSIELRKALFKFLRMHNFEWVFPTRHGDRLTYRNSVRDFKALCGRLGINGVRTSWHTLRHGFALNYVRQGGSLFHLQKAMGHSTLQMTRRYCELTEDDLKLMHKKTSILGRLR